MAFSPADVAAAVAEQEGAAHDAAATVRLVAGPGTGKSATVEERVRWLLATGVSPEAIFVVSFTRASSAELRERVRAHCQAHGEPGGDTVSVSTLHSLALRVLRRAGLLVAYPAGPMVLDDWELRHVFDAEYSTDAGITPSRGAEIRREHEAFWSTGQWTPANWIPPDPAISPQERSHFNGFHRPRTQTYACVLPGEIVRAAVDQITAGALDARALLELTHVVVDEFQDLNPADLEFIEHLTREGAVTFVAGDDDQSIYSFRFADPSGIQRFVASHPGTGDHELRRCFRCTSEVLAPAVSLIGQNGLPGRLPKHLVSLYTTAAPPIAGEFDLWRFDTHRSEARALAQSCRSLIDAGVDPEQILILLSDRNALALEVTSALDQAGVPHEAARFDAFKDGDEGRAILATLRTICDPDDYVALRVMLGLLSGVGLTTCNRIANHVVNSNLNFRNLFFQPLPGGVFSARETTALERIRAFTLSLAGWDKADTLQMRAVDLRRHLDELYGPDVARDWDGLTSSLPTDATLDEVLQIAWAESDQQAAETRLAVYARLAIEPPDDAGPLPAVRLMTMHRAKGLSAQVVFIPGLEEEVFPGERRRPYPGLILEAARLLYVSITRARACCVVSYARRRTRFGQFRGHTPSRFVADLGVPVVDRADGFTPAQAGAVTAICRAI